MKRFQSSQWLHAIGWQLLPYDVLNLEYNSDDVKSIRNCFNKVELSKNSVFFFASFVYRTAVEWRRWLLSYITQNTFASEYMHWKSSILFSSSFSSSHFSKVFMFKTFILVCMSLRRLSSDLNILLSLVVLFKKLSKLIMQCSWVRLIWKIALLECTSLKNVPTQTKISFWNE